MFFVLKLGKHTLKTLKNLYMNDKKVNDIGMVHLPK